MGIGEQIKSNQIDRGRELNERSSLSAAAAYTVVVVRIGRRSPQRPILNDSERLLYALCSTLSSLAGGGSGD